MNITIHWPGTPVTAALRARVKQRVGLALGRFGDGIGQVTVRFAAEGRVNRCEIHVAVRVRELRVEHADADPARALDQAAARLSERIALALERPGA
jgi:ribosomal subunit interface protein